VAVAAAGRRGRDLGDSGAARPARFRTVVFVP
jgi:hypothetical protein